MSQVITLEASDLGYAPGSFPRVFKYHGEWFEFSHKCEDREGDLMYIEYRLSGVEQYSGKVVRIFND